jgi:hypothetical protein
VMGQGEPLAHLVIPELSLIVRPVPLHFQLGPLLGLLPQYQVRIFRSARWRHTSVKLDDFQNLHSGFDTPLRHGLLEHLDGAGH